MNAKLAKAKIEHARNVEIYEAAQRRVDFIKWPVTPERLVAEMSVFAIEQLDPAVREIEQLEKIIESLEAQLAQAEDTVAQMRFEN